MVKEVEFSNFLEVLSDSMMYSEDAGRPTFTGSLKDDGKTLEVTVLKGGTNGGRKIYVLFGNVDFDTRMVDYIDVGESELDLNIVNPGKVYTFDLTKVLQIPRKVYDTRGSSEITIELYTYEANINTDYGTKRLSVPYTVESATHYEYSTSTDGVYKVALVDYAYWDNTITYNVGDIVIDSNDTLMISTIDGNTGNDPTLSDYWTSPTKEEILDYAYGTTTNEPINSVLSDMLISRYAKYKYIKEAMSKMTYKEHDNELALAQSLLLQAFREQAMVNIYKHKPIDAAESLQLLKLAANDPAEVATYRVYNIKYTT